MSTLLRSPVSWFGGKGQQLSRLLPLLPPHTVYVEVFGGAGHLLMAKPPSPAEIYNDLDSGLVNFFRVLRDPALFDALHRKIALTPWSREEYWACAASWESTDDPVERAFRWYVVARQSFSGEFGNSWGSARDSVSGMVSTAAKWLRGIERLPAIHGRLLRVQVEHQDWRLILARYDSPETFFYCDPPYIPDTRSGSGQYRYELTAADHSELVAQLLPLHGGVLLSGYAHPLYTPLEAAGWTRRDTPTYCAASDKTRRARAVGQRTHRVESVWMNYPLPAQTQMFQEIA